MRGVVSVFDAIIHDDLIITFFPCIYFCQMSQYAQSLNYINYRSLSESEAIEKILERQRKRQEYLSTLTKFVKVCIERGLRMIFENPVTGSFLNNYFLKPPTIIDRNRMLRGDYFVKPTGYWFWNCEPTDGLTIQHDKVQRRQNEAESRWSAKSGTCNEERSMISPDYARNFINDFILGKEQTITQKSLFAI